MYKYVNIHEINTLKLKVQQKLFYNVCINNSDKIVNIKSNTERFSVMGGLKMSLYIVLIFSNRKEA